jgi:hypothetical protein
MAADGGDRRAPPGRGELDAVVRPVGDELALGEPLHRHRHRAGRDAERLGERAGLRLAAVACQAVDRLQRLALRPRDRGLAGFDDPKPMFRVMRDQKSRTVRAWACS